LIGACTTFWESAWRPSSNFFLMEACLRIGTITCCLPFGVSHLKSLASTSPRPPELYWTRYEKSDEDPFEMVESDDRSIAG